MKKLLATLAAVCLPAAVQAAPYELADLPVCTALTPAAISLDSTPVTLDVRVLLDGVSLSDAKTIVAKAQSSYQPMGLTLVASYASVSFTGLEGSELIGQAKAYYGGTRPAGIDLVYVLTSKDITDGGASGTGLAGLADCIGGVKYADRAFAVGEAWDLEPVSLLGLYTLNEEKAAKTLAHELGHLLGGHHHQANCAESLVNIGGSPCTLMFNFLDLQASGFSLLNGVVVRGHAQSYANP